MAKLADYLSVAKYDIIPLASFNMSILLILDAVTFFDALMLHFPSFLRYSLIVIITPNLFTKAFLIFLYVISNRFCSRGFSPAS